MVSRLPLEAILTGKKKTKQNKQTYTFDEPTSVNINICLI